MTSQIARMRTTSFCTSPEENINGYERSRTYSAFELNTIPARVA